MSEVVMQETQTIVKPQCDIVAAMASDFREELKALIDDGAKELVVDLEGVEMVDSDGLGALIFAHKLLNKNGGTFTISNASTDIRAFFRIMRLDKQFLMK